MTPDQQALHDALLMKLFDVFDANCIGMNLDTGVKLVNNFAAYMLYRMHKETEQLDLLSPEKEAVMIHGLIEEFVKNDTSRV